MPVAIVTDSAAALPAELVARFGITVVPMWLTRDGESFHDGTRPLELDGDVGPVSTSGPTPGEFAEAIQRVANPDGVLVLTISKEMSSTHESAVVGAQALDSPVRVLDTETAAGAEALVVLAAAQAAARGAPIDTVDARARAAMARVRLVATVPNLDYLVRSGRVPGIAGWAGRRLRISPLFEFASGRVKRLRPALSADAALDRIVSLWRRSRAERAALHVVALHAHAEQEAKRLLDVVEQESLPSTAFLGEFSSVMVAHTGPGLVGLAWWWDPEITGGP
jgi:DegV family protein with EDD domain